MHTISKKTIDLDNFSIDDGILDSPEVLFIFNNFVNEIDKLRQNYLETKDNTVWRAMIQMLPASWNQKRTITLNYEILRNMYTWRKNHKLSEWREFCEWIEKLPYAKELILYGLDKEK